jgi:GH25 family lysozyme M1 (1,4-beta-N-acetylmuramidase)
MMAQGGFLVKIFSNRPSKTKGFAQADRPMGFKHQVQSLLSTNPPFPPSSTDPRILGADISQNNGLMDFGAYTSYGPPHFEFIIIRSGQSSSSSWDDTEFLRNWQQAKSIGLPRSVYHVLFPALEVEPQVRHFLDLMDKAGDLGEGPIWLDVELQQSQSKKRISDTALEWLELVRKETNHRAGIYSGKWFTDEYMEPQDWWAEVDWWLATYIWPNQTREHPGPPGLPVGVPLNACKIHQTTSFGDGKLVGAGSQRIDLDRWMGTREEFAQYFGVDQPAPPPPPSDLEARVAANEKSIAELGDSLRKLVEWAKDQGYNET